MVRSAVRSGGDSQVALETSGENVLRDLLCAICGDLPFAEIKPKPLGWEQSRGFDVYNAIVLETRS